jgi:fructuronate reductase
MRYVGGVDDAGQAIEICDPLLPVIQQAVAASADGEARVKALLGIEAIFRPGAAAGARFVSAVTRAYVALQRQGAKPPSPRGLPRNNLFPVSVMGSTPALLLFLHGSADKSFLLSIGFSS